MADQNTTRYGLVKPEVGASADTWGAKLNTDMDDLDAIGGAITTTGSANAYVLTTSLSLAAYVAGQSFDIKASFGNTGAATINVDSLGAKSLTKNGTTALASGDIVSGNIYRISYDGTQFQIIGGSLSTGYQPLDGDLTAIAALTSAADKVPYSTGSGTWALADLTSFGRSLIDDAAASNARITLGLVIGTDVQAYDADLTTLGAGGSGARDFLGLGTANQPQFAAIELGHASDTTLSRVSAGLVAVEGNTVAMLSTANVFVSGQSIGTGTGASATNINSGATSAGYIEFKSAGTAVWDVGRYVSTVGDGIGFYSYVAGALVVSISTAGAVAAVSIKAPAPVSAETSGTLTSASANSTVNASGGVTINDGVFTAGDRVEIYAGSSSRTITQDTGMTLRLDGTSTTGNRTLAAYGRMSVYFVSNSEAICSGSGVS